MLKTVPIRTKRGSANYAVEIRRHAVDSAGRWAKRVLGGVPKVCVVSNKKVFGLYGQELVEALSKAGLDAQVHLIGEGERFKNLKTLSEILDAFSRHGISRSGAVIGFGGGVVGDIAGFAASVHLRGVDYLQIPTTLLAMVDSSVGGKTGINTTFGKNLIGTFYQPQGVLIDPNVISTLPEREVMAGFCECIKHGVLAGEKLLSRTISVLDHIKHLEKKELTADFETFLADQVSFKAKIVAGDEKELPIKTDVRSRKILNFGHTFAHALEKATDYRYLKHGEAVGYGIIFAAEISKKLGLLDVKVVNLLSDVVHRAGKLPSIGHIEPDSISAALRHDKKYINDSLQWVLLKGIGKPVIIPHGQVGDKLVKSTVKELISST